jgi:hypothetical protein
MPWQKSAIKMYSRSNHIIVYEESVEYLIIKGQHLLAGLFVGSGAVV